MHETPDRLPASRSEFLEFVEAGPHAEILRDESRLRTIVIDAMKQSDELMTREIGEGLAGGTMSWNTIATASAYSGFLEQSFAALREFDFTALNEELKAIRELTLDAPTRSDDDEEDLWLGLGRDRRQ